MASRFDVRAIDAAGTPSALTFLRGDGMWEEMTSGGGSGDAGPPMPVQRQVITSGDMPFGSTGASFSATAWVRLGSTGVTFPDVSPGDKILMTVSFCTNIVSNATNVMDFATLNGSVLRAVTTGTTGLYGLPSLTLHSGEGTTTLKRSASVFVEVQASDIATDGSVTIVMVQQTSGTANSRVVRSDVNNPFVLGGVKLAGAAIGGSRPYAEAPLPLSASMFSGTALTNPSRFCDGLIPQDSSAGTAYGTWGTSAVAIEYLTCDLGSVKTLSRIQVVPYFYVDGNRSYNDLRIDVSTDGTTWTNLLSAASAKATEEGYVAVMPNGMRARYVRYGTSGSNINTGKHCVEFIVYQRIPAAVGTLEGSAVVNVNDLLDVDTMSAPPAHGQSLIYDAGTGLWKPGAPVSSPAGGDAAWRVIGSPGQPAFQNNWAHYLYTADDPTSYAPARFRKDAMGFVHLQGMVKGGTTTQDTTIFTLPVGYRPNYRLLLGVTTASSGLNFAVGRFDVYADGSVKYVAGSASNWINLGDIPSFFADQ